MTKIEIPFTNNMKSHTMYVGFDDTDSPKGMCTTYLAYKMVNLLKKEKVTFLDFPNLIRFNPNIPCGSLFIVRVPESIVVISKFPNWKRLKLLIEGPRSGADAWEAVAETKVDDPIIKLRRFINRDFFILPLWYM